MRWAEMEAAGWPLPAECRVGPVLEAWRRYKAFLRLAQRQSML